MNKLSQFTELFKQYNEHTNLMSRNDVEKLEDKHIPDCLNINKFFEKYKYPKNLLDIGTGGGFPSIPIALEFPDIEVYAMDSINKKINFIKEIKNKLEVKNLTPICSRIEDFDKKEFFETVTTRAVASLSTILEYSAPFVKTNGYIIAYKSKMAEEELEEAKNAMKILGIKYVEKIDYKISEDYERCLLIFQKIKQTPNTYPRKNNLARKNPL